MKRRISVTLTEPYLDALSLLIEEGLYLGKGEIIMEALRTHFREKGIPPFTKRLEEPR